MQRIKPFSHVLGAGVIVALLCASAAHAQASHSRAANDPTVPTPVAPLMAGDGVTAVSGRIVTTEGKALVNVTVSDGGQKTVSDADGRYLLTNIPIGNSVLLIDAHKAGGKQKADFGYYEVQITATAGQTTVLPYVNWLPRIDHKHDVVFASPTKREVIITNPSLPGLEIHIPKGTVLTGPDHKIVRRAGITRIPLDRTPFPLPQNVQVPIYFTVQPGGAVLSGDDGTWVGASVWYPNFDHQLPKARATFFKYDPYQFGWTVYGVGTVDDHQKHYVPDPETRIYNLSSAMIDAGFTPAGNPPPAPPACKVEACGNGGRGPGNGGSGGPGSGSGAGGPPPGATPPKPPPGTPGSPPDGPPGGPPKPPSPKPPCCGASSGDPVDLASGLWTDTTTDLSLPDVMPLNVARTYLAGDVNVRSFGVGMALNYETYLWSAHQYTEADLIMPQGSRVHYVRTSSGTSYTDAVFTASTNPGPYFNSTIAWSGHGWTLTLQDGSVYDFPDYAPVDYIQDRYGNRISFLRPAGKATPITEISSPNGRSVTFTYTSGVITAATDNLGRTVTYSYDASKRLQTVTDPDGGVTTYTWDTVNNRITAVQRAKQHPSGPSQVTNLYNAQGRIQTQTLADGTTWNYTYVLNGSGQVTETDETDPNGKFRKVTFNAGGYWLTQKVAFGTAVEQDYTAVLGGSTPPTACTGNTPSNSPSNYPIAMTDALSRLTCWTYDSGGRILTTTILAGTADVATTTSTYDLFGNILTIQDPLGHTTTIARDTLGRPTSVTDATSNVWTVVANSDGTIASSTDPLGHATSYTYDHGDLVSITDALSRVITRYTDSIGRPLQITDPVKGLWQWTYDPLWGLLTATDPNGNVSTKSYNLDGGVATSVDPRSTVGTPIQTQYAYDTSDRITTRTDPLGHAGTAGSYDGNGNVLSATDRKGQAASYTYDALNRVSTATYADGHALTYTWDAGNRLTGLQDVISGVATTISRTYDSRDRLTEENVSQGGTTISTIDYTYDAADRRATATVAGQAGVSYTWNNANRLTQLTQGTATTSFGYDIAGRRTSLTYPNGIVATYTFDNANRTTQISFDKGATNVGLLTYSYDESGRVTQRGGSLFASILPAAVASASYNNNNQLTAWGSASLSYDLNGNLTGDGTNTFSWDARNRLIGILGGPSFAYDGDGRRLSATAGGVSNATVYDVNEPVQELAGGSVQSNILTGNITDERITRTESGVAKTYLADRQGSIVALTNSSGSIQTSYSYTPHGVTSASGSASTNSYQYAGRANDGTGLYYYRARYYSPSLTRFISEDPMGLSADGNLYSYARNNPVGSQDPFGLWTLQFGGSASLAGFGGVGTGFFGAAVDSQGNFGVYYGAGVGAAQGASSSASVSGAVSDADTICQLGGGFGQAGRVGGWGEEATGDVFWGPSGDRMVYGTGASYGVGAGASSYVMTTNTNVIPLGRLW